MESTAVQDLLLQLGNSGPFAGSASLALDLELMGPEALKALESAAEDG